MTAPRTCRTCGTPLPPSVRWCGMCHEPVRELSPRPRSERAYVEPIKPDVHSSRWRGNALTFGPAGRIAITASVVLFGATFVIQGFNPAMIWPLGMYTIASTVVLREVWKPVRIQPRERETSSTPERPVRHPMLHRRVPSRPLIALAGVLTVVVAVVSLRHTSALDLFLPGCALVMLAFGYVITRLYDL
jgi:hypothetical protein